MAKKKVNRMDKYKQRNGYNNPVNKDDPYQKTSEWKLKVTEPGQAISVRKLVERYEKGSRERYSTN